MNLCIQDTQEQRRLFANNERQKSRFMPELVDTAVELTNILLKKNRSNNATFYSSQTKSLNESSNANFNYNDAYYSEDEDSVIVLRTRGRKHQQQQDQPLRKRQKRRNSNGSASNRFRPHHTEMWQKRFAELVEFQRIYKHCLVPSNYDDTSELCRWVRRQRYQYNLFQQKKHSSTTLKRIQNLNEIGFVWDSREALWQERLRELLDFEAEFGNCDVPAVYPSNPPLGSWVKCQRRQYKLFLEGKPSNMTKDRQIELEKYGFQWKIRKSLSFKPSYDKTITTKYSLPSELREKIHTLSLRDIEHLSLLNALSKSDQTEKFLSTRSSSSVSLLPIYT